MLLNRYLAYFCCLFIFASNNFIYCFDFQDWELDLFDLVENVGENFYTVFELEQNCETSEIRKTYRKLSLIWHPDKNPGEEAEKKFRQIVGIYDVLKDDEKRKRYDEILENGLPDWRDPIYYYRRYRNMGFFEIGVIILIIVIIGHYFMLWAQYFEKKLCLDEKVGEARKRIIRKEKKDNKKSNKNINVDEIDKSLNQIYDILEKPSIKSTLPIAFGIWLYTNNFFIPQLRDLIIKLLKKEKVDDSSKDDDLKERKRREKQEKQEAIEKQRRELINQLNPTKIETSNYKPLDLIQSNKTETSEDDKTKITIKNRKVWDDEDKAALIKAVAKFPGGTTDRWTKIAQFVGKPVDQCIQMEKTLKANITSSSATSLQNKKLLSHGMVDDNVMTKRDDFAESNADVQQQPVWSQEQQKQLENALKQTDKNDPNRWDKIAEAVTGKAKNECIQRYKVLCQNAIKQKSNA